MTGSQRDASQDTKQVFPAGTVEPQPVSWLPEARAEVKPWSLLNVKPEPQDVAGVVTTQGELESVFGAPQSSADAPAESQAEASVEGVEVAEEYDVILDEVETPGETSEEMTSVEGETSADGAMAAEAATPGESSDGEADVLSDTPESDTTPELSPDDALVEVSSEEVSDAALLDAAMPVDEPLEAPPVDAPAEPCPLCEQTRAEAAEERQQLIESLEQPMVDAAGVFQRAAVELSRGLTENMIQLSLELAAAALKKTASISTDVLLANLDNAMALIGPVESLTVRCHPDDASVLRAQDADRLTQATGGVVEVSVREDAELGRGECIVDFHEGLVDARWGIQLERLSSALGPLLQRHVLEQVSTMAADAQAAAAPSAETPTDHQVEDTSAPTSEEPS